MKSQKKKNSKTSTNAEKILSISILRCRIFVSTYLGQLGITITLSLVQESGDFCLGC